MISFDGAMVSIPGTFFCIAFGKRVFVTVIPGSVDLENLGFI